MNRHICLTVGAQVVLTSFSNALHTVDKTPIEGTNYYKVKYELDKEGGFDQENGLLKEVITKLPSTQPESEKQTFEIRYTYHNYKVKKNNHLLNLKNNNGYINRNSTAQVGTNFEVLSIEDWHPVVFHLNNLRSGIIPAFDKEGSRLSVKLKDNSHTYYNTCNSRTAYKDLSSLNIEYEVVVIENIVNTKNNTQTPTYTFNWRVLSNSLLGGYTQRHGKIQVDHLGNIKRLNTYVPQRISMFYLSSQVEEQSGWLNLSTISQEKFQKIANKDPLVAEAFQIEPEQSTLTQAKENIIVGTPKTTTLWNLVTSMFEVDPNDPLENVR